MAKPRLSASSSSGSPMTVPNLKLADITDPECKESIRDFCNAAISAIDDTVRINVRIPAAFPNGLREVITILIANYNLIYENLLAILRGLQDDPSDTSSIRLKNPISLDITQQEVEDMMKRFSTDQLVEIRAVLFAVANQINTCDSVTTHVSAGDEVPSNLKNLIRQGATSTEEAKQVAVTSIRQIISWTTEIIRRQKTEKIHEEIETIRDSTFQRHASAATRFVRPPLTISDRTHIAVSAGIMRVAAWLVPNQYLGKEIELERDGKPRLGVIGEGIEKTRIALGMTPVSGNSVILRILMARHQHQGGDSNPLVWIDPEPEDLDIRLAEYEI